MRFIVFWPVALLFAGVIAFGCVRAGDWISQPDPHSDCGRGESLSTEGSRGGGASNGVAATLPAVLIASWYGEEHRGRLMANGRRFNPDRHTCASWDYPLGTRLLVCSGRRAMTVEVTDRGPNRRLLGSRQIDLSQAAFSRIGNLDRGLAEVRVSVLSIPAP